MAVYLPPLPSQGQYIFTTLGNAAALCAKPGLPPRAVPLSVSFSAYKPQTNCVNINLQNGVTNPIDQIATVYVDNSHNSHQTLIIFPDTGFIIEAAAFTTGFYPVITNQLQMIVYNQGYTVGDVCNLFPLNIFIPPSESSGNTLGVNYLLGSNGIYVPQVTGDQTLTRSFAVNVPGTFTLLTPVNGIQVTAYRVTMAIVSNPLAAGALGSGGGQVEVVLTAGSFTMEDVATGFWTSTSCPPIVPMMDRSGVQLHTTLPITLTLNALGASVQWATINVSIWYATTNP